MWVNCFASRRLRSCRHVSCFMPCVSFRNLQELLCGIIMHPSAFNTGSVALAFVQVTFVNTGSSIQKRNCLPISRQAECQYAYLVSYSRVGQVHCLQEDQGSPLPHPSDVAHPSFISHHWSTQSTFKQYAISISHAQRAVLSMWYRYTYQLKHQGKSRWMMMLGLEKSWTERIHGITIDWCWCQFQFRRTKREILSIWWCIQCVIFSKVSKFETTLFIQTPFLCTSYTQTGSLHVQWS